MKYIGFIFARGGSKGLPQKNILPFAGKPLIAWAIEQAKAIPRIQRVVVSTDDPKIAKIAVHYGAEVPFRRPPDLAKDNTPEWLAWQHALKWLKQHEGVLPEAMVSIPATCPLRSPKDIEAALDEFEKGKADGVITITKAHRNPCFNMVKKGKDGRVVLINTPTLHVSRRQDAPKVFDVTTAAYVLRPSFVMKKNYLFSGRIRAIEVPTRRAVDIDSYLEFQIAEFLFKKQKKRHAA